MDEFTDVDAKTTTSRNPLIVGITGPSFSGKTYSALELATGMKETVGGEIFLIDAEDGRSLQYKNRFDFRFVKFSPPFSPLRYEKALDHCVARGAKIVIVDNMSLEHGGDGGVLDMVEDFLAKKAGDDWSKREAYKWMAQIEPKRQRKSLNNKIEQLGDVIFILLYRADDKVKPGKSKRGGGGGEPIHLGWTAETTSKLPYSMTIRFLLPPASDGRPNLTPDTEFEKLSIKMPVMFRDWFKPGLQLNRELGKKLAQWSVGSEVAAKPPLPMSATAVQQVIANELGAYAEEVAASVECATPEQVDEIKSELERLKLNPGQVTKWCQRYGATSPEGIPSDRAVDALATLMKQPDPKS